MPTCAGSRTTPEVVRSELGLRGADTLLLIARSSAKDSILSEMLLIDWDKLRTRQEYLANRRNAVRNDLRPRFRGYFVVLFVLGILLVVLDSPRATAQTEKASVSGRVTDQNNAALPDAEVQIRNTDTGVATTVKTNGEGIYAVPSLNPGNYVMTVNKPGFRTVSVTGMTLNVQENLSHNFALQVGSTVESITVEAGADLIQTTSSDLGTVIDQKAIHELPLSGRNFSQLLTLTPGATPISTAQSNGVAVNDLGMLGVPTASVAQPAIQGQFNRSNLYLLDGTVNTELTTSAYIIPPIIDAMQEFKVQSHDDQAEYGSVLGGVVNVVTRSGTNQLHGSAWEFLRNDVFDARDHFKDQTRTSPGALRQNQFGAMISGPVLLPKLYNGRNRTFFTFAYEGWRFSQALGAQPFYRVPTDAELMGDFSNTITHQNIYDPASPGTQFVSSSNPGASNYNPACTLAAGCPNMIPANRIDATALNFIKAYYARPNFTPPPGNVQLASDNAVVTRALVNNSDHYNFRVDEQLGSKDNLFFRYDRLNVVNLTPLTISGNTGASVPALNYGVGWTHVFNSSLVLENRIGRSQRPFSRFQTDSAGTGPMTGLGFKQPGGTLFNLSSPWGNGGLQNANGIESPVTSFSHSLTWIRGGHQFKFGFQYVKQGNNTNSPPYGNYTFSDATTGNGTANTGYSLASALLGLPSQSNNTGTVVLGNRVSTWAGYFQDGWKLRRNLTFTYGLRLDHRRSFDPSSGTVVSGPNTDGTWWIGLDKLPPPCSTTPTPPCIPGGGTLASIPNGDKIQLSPYGRAFGPGPDWSDIGPRVGLAWQANERTVVRGGYGIVYDPLMGFEQDWKGIAGSWPSAGGVFANTALNQPGQPLTLIESTFGQVGALALPGPSPWGSLNWFFDPHQKDPRSQQWNLEIQREMTKNLALTVGYVGSHSDRLASTGLWNTATTPGGTPPFPWYNGTTFYTTSTGKGTYNALQAKLEHHYANGFQYLVSYTWSKSIDVGSSGFFDVENGPGGTSALQDYYHPEASRSVSSYDIPHFLSMSGVWDLPFGRGKRYLNSGIGNQIIGNWQVNGVVQLRSGQPYNLAANGSDPAKIGNTVSWWNYARPNLVGNPTPAHQTPNEWFDPTAFAVPNGSYGNFGRNVLRSAPVYDADLSVFKNFPVGESFLLSFRAEFFNAFNIQNYGAPNSLIGNNPSAGIITSNVLPPRQLQFGLHLGF
jgi:hypothetical protein